MVHRIAHNDGMPKGLKITKHTGQVLYDSNWIAGVDYDEDQFDDEDYDPDSDNESDEDESDDSNDDDDDDDDDMIMNPLNLSETMMKMQNPKRREYQSNYCQRTNHP